MPVLHRLLKRLFPKRHPAGLHQHLLHDFSHLVEDLGNLSVKHILVLVEARFRYQSRPLPLFSWDMHEALCHKSIRRQEESENSASAVSCEEAFSNLVIKGGDSVSSHAINSRLAPCKKRSDFALAKGELDRDTKDSGLHKAPSHDLRVAGSEPAFTRTYNFEKEHPNKLDGHSKFFKSSIFGLDSCKPFLQNAKRDFHTFPDEVSALDSRTRSANMNEGRHTHVDGEFEVDATEIPIKNTGEKTENQALRSTMDFVENLEAGLHKENKEGVMSQAALDKLVLDRRDGEEKHNDFITLHHEDIALKFAASSTKTQGHVPRACERGYFTILAKKKKNRRKNKKKRSWEAEKLHRPDELKTLNLSPSLNQIGVAGTASCVEKLNMHGKASLPNYNYVMSKLIAPFVHQDSLGQADLVGTNVHKKVEEHKSISVGQEVSKQMNCVEHLEDEDASQGLLLEEDLFAKDIKLSKDLMCEKSTSNMKEVSRDIGVNGAVIPRQESSRDMEPNMHKGRPSLETIGKGKGICDKDDACYHGRGKFIVDDFKASTSSDFYSKRCINAQIEALEKGVDGDVCHLAGASKVQYPIGNLSVNHLYLILDLNGVLIKRWNVNPSLPGVSKLNRRWIQLRPGCIEFLDKAFSKFKVGIWSTMTHKNVMGVCRLLEQQACHSLPFFMLWSKDCCYQQSGIRRPDKSHVLADFKPLSHVWHFFEPYIGFHNTVLIDDSPYKACMNNPHNCVFPDAYEGGTDDSYLTDVLWPYLEGMRVSQNIQAYIASNPLGQQPIVVGHKLFHHVQGVMANFNHHIHPSCAGDLSGKVESFDSRFAHAD